ncbi:MAG TPA: transcription termination factor Rho [bacterium]|nr:transcription termination factor Rho [bacterium]
MKSYQPSSRSRRPRPRKRQGTADNQDSNRQGQDRQQSGQRPQGGGGSKGNSRGGRWRRKNNRVDSGYTAQPQTNDGGNQNQRSNGPGQGGGGRRGRGGRQGGRRTKIPIGELPAMKMIQQGISIDPFERLKLETTAAEVTTRALDLVSPIGRGQRCLVVAPPMAGKTTLLIKISNAISENHPDIHLKTLLVDERPEEVTHFKRSTQAEVHAASSDMSAADHIQIAEACVNGALELVLEGKDVVLLLDSITRLARAYNTMADSGGRTLSGGLDSQTMLVPRQIFGAARKIEDGGSLTIVGTALIDTGSRMDEVIFQEFKGTGNMELFLSRELFTKRIFPCIDIEKSGTRKEEKLVRAQDLPRIHLLRRHMTAMKAHEAMSFLLELLSRYKSNADLLSSLVAKV